MSENKNDLLVVNNLKKYFKTKSGLLHAVDDILESAGVSDTNGETDAYLLGCMFEHFFSVLEKDKKESLQNENR